jgi:hypothetical protein
MVDITDIYQVLHYLHGVGVHYIFFFRYISSFFDTTSSLSHLHSLPRSIQI